MSLDTPVIGRLEKNLFVLDFRTVAPDDLPVIQTSFARLLHGN